MANINPRLKLVDLDEDLSTVVIAISDEYAREDKEDRENNRPLWLKLENYFSGLQRIYWSMVAKDWRYVDEDANTRSNTNRHYDKVINIYRAHGESIIAALSVKTPSTIFYPEDADVEEDIITAKVCIKIKEQIERHNTAQLLMIKSLMILWNTGTVAAYIYNRKSSKYGTYSQPQYDKDPETVHTVLLNCPECESNIDEVVFHSEKGKVAEEEKECPVCGFQGIPNQEEYEEQIPKIIGSIVNPKSRTIIEVFSPLFVHIPFYAREQEHIPYLRLKFEQHFSMVKNIYPKLAKKGITPGTDRNDVEFRGLDVNTNDSNLVTVECLWIRPWAFDIIEDKDKEIKRLKDKFPDGIYAVIIDGNLVEIHNEALDDHWEISNSPLTTYIHGEPLGKPLAPIQELTNEVVDLQIETFEHAIPETFARGDVLNFQKYGKAQAAPGMVFPVVAPADGSSIASSFHTLKTATLSEETDVFSRRLDEKGQFVSASFPSIYGGPSISGSKTAKEYTESRSMALQRLSLPWNTIKFFWAGIMSKAVPLFIHELKASGEDYKSVDKATTGFINNWITQDDVSGSIGRVEADPSEDLPQSAAQLKDIFMQLMSLKDDDINSALHHPQNTPLLTKALGNPDFYIPGTDERNKQYEEFRALLRGETVEITAVDNNPMEAEICRTFLIGSTGLMIKRNNLDGWNAILEHMNAHIAAEQAKQTGAMPNPNMPSEEQKASAGPVNPEGVGSV